MDYPEALRLSRVLASDMTSQVAAALNGWQEPVSPIYLAIKTLVDNDVASKTEKRAKLTRLRDPFAPPPKRLGNASLSIPELRALLARQREGDADV